MRAVTITVADRPDSNTVEDRPGREPRDGEVRLRVAAADAKPDDEALVAGVHAFSEPNRLRGMHMPEKLPEPLLDLLRATSLCFISTVMPDGSPQLTQTWVDTDGTHILINTAQGFQKVRNIRRNPHVAVAIADPQAPLRYFSVRGEVTSISTDGAAEHVEELSQRYFGGPFPWPNGRDEKRVILAITAHKIHTPG